MPKRLHNSDNYFAGLQTYSKEDNKRTKKKILKQAKLQQEAKTANQNYEMSHQHKNHHISRKLFAVICTIGIVVLAIIGVGTLTHYHRDSPSVNEPNNNPLQFSKKKHKKRIIHHKKHKSDKEKIQDELRRDKRKREERKKEEAKYHKDNDKPRNIHRNTSSDNSSDSSSDKSNRDKQETANFKKSLAQLQKKEQQAEKVNNVNNSNSTSKNFMPSSKSIAKSTHRYDMSSNSTSTKNKNPNQANVSKSDKTK